MGNEIINNLMYADDLVIMAPSVAGLSKLGLLRICDSHDIIIIIIVVFSIATTHV